MLFPVHALHQPFRKSERRFKAVRKAADYTLLYHQSVHHHGYGVLYVLVEVYVRRAVVVTLSVHFHAHITALAETFEQLCKFALSAAHDGRYYHHLASFGQGHYLVGYLIHRLAHYFLAALRTVGHAYTRV